MRWIFTAPNVAIFAQPVFAGRYMIGDYDMLALHRLGAYLVNFRVLSRGGREPGPYDAGRKDTVDLRPGEAVEVIARFDGYRGRYMFHCHNLEHEDMGMMANFETI
jgi:FtsP/CotA-like multicopper oxidase with cupredoxin domain